MRLPKRGEKGFTLIELLIVVAILGVLAAVVIPNVGRFIGRGEEEAAATEFANIQTAVVAMMVDNMISTIEPRTDATDNMSQFPEAVDGLPDWVLYGCVLADNTTVNYVATEITTKSYTVTSDGTVAQVP